MLLSLRKIGLTSLSKEVTGFSSLEVAKRTKYSEDKGFQGAFFPCEDSI